MIKISIHHTYLRDNGTYCARGQSRPEGQKPTRYNGQGTLRMCLFGQAGPAVTKAMVVSLVQGNQEDCITHPPYKSLLYSFCILVFFDVV